MIKNGQVILKRRAPDDLIDVPLVSVAGLIGTMVHRVIEDGNIPSVGGQVQLASVTGDGIYYPHIRRSSDEGATWQSDTRHEDFRSVADMVEVRSKGRSDAEFIVPLLDNCGHFRNGLLAKIWTRPGPLSE